MNNKKSSNSFQIDKSNETDDKGIKSSLYEMKILFQRLQTIYERCLPKVDRMLIHDLLSRQKKDPRSNFYMVEIFTKRGTDPEKKREHIIKKTGMAPSIHDNNTHYATNHRVTLELLEELSRPEEVLYITGDYTGGLVGVGASHEYRR